MHIVTVTITARTIFVRLYLIALTYVTSQSTKDHALLPVTQTFENRVLV